MSEALIREIAEKIIKEQFLIQWEYYTLLIALFLITGFGSAYIGAYARRKGETLATKADFNILLQQLTATTAIAEDVKSRISHADWATRERLVLRRIKLEELLQAVHELQIWQAEERSQRIFGANKAPGPSPLPRVQRIAGLYFPELKVAVIDFCQSHRKMSIALLTCEKELLEFQNNFLAQKAVREKFSQAWMLEHQAQLDLVLKIEKEAQKIMADLISAQPFY
jgi:hypothetical protein